MKNNKLKAKYLAVLLLLLGFYKQSKAQQELSKSLTDVIANKMQLYGIKRPEPLLYIHFDRNIYAPNDNVWFTGYFFNLINKNDYQTLSVALVKDEDQTVLTGDKYMIRNNLCFGNTVIPDTASSGNYSFVAFTNRLLDGKPDILFTQKITIRGNRPAGYYATLNPLDTAMGNQHQKMMLMVTSSTITRKLPDIAINYYVGNYANPVLKGHASLKNGQYIFDVPSSVLYQGSNRLHIRFKINSESNYLSVDLPAKTKPAVIHFFPEGGNLVGGVDNVIAWEAKSRAGVGIRCSAVLYEGQNIIDTISTNNYGFGKFKVKPQGKPFSVKLLNSKTDTVYNLPAALAHTVRLSVATALVNNELYVDLKAVEPQRVNLMVHRYTELYSSTPVEVTANGKRVKILLDAIPKGLAEISLTDSLGRPLAERTFFAHYDKKRTLQINTDKSQYAIHQKVNLKLKLDNTELPDSGLVSIACVQEDKLDPIRQNDIESYLYLKNQFGELPAKSNYMGSQKDDKNFLEYVLLIKNWRRYTWQDMLNTTSANTTNHWDNIVFSGRVTSYGVSIKRPLQVMNLNYPLNVMWTDSSGRFDNADSSLISKFGKRIRFFVNGDKRKIYQVNIDDPYFDMTRRVVRDMALNDRGAVVQTSTPQQQNAVGAIMLREVNITDATLRLQGANIYANECGDYVCRYHIFNCRNHPHEADNRMPVIGSFYLGLVGPYQGCEVLKPNEFKFKGIYAAQEFYPSDLSQPNSPPEYLSTIYWKYLAKVTASKEAEFSFYTNDLMGRFKIIVQGRTTNDVVYGEKTFEVK